MNDKTPPPDKRIRLRSGIELPPGATLIRAQVSITTKDPETGIWTDVATGKNVPEQANVVPMKRKKRPPA